MTFSVPDLIITVAYFSIPVQILVALCKFPRLTRRATARVVILLILFALFIFLCGAGHLLRCIDHAHTTLFVVVNWLTAAVSLGTAIYLLPFVPHLLEGTDKLYLEATTSKKIVESLYPATIRERLLNRDGAPNGNDMHKKQAVMPKNENENKSNGDEPKKGEEEGKRHRSKRNLFDRMGRSDSMAVKAIQDFIQRGKRRSLDRGSIYSTTSDYDDKLAVSEPIADTFQSTSIMFCDIVSFTHWCAKHSPNQVFTLLESLFFEFDQIANQMSVFKLSTVGDCYIAATGVPYPREDHAIILVQFAERCRKKAAEVMERLSEQSGMEDVCELNTRIGIHSGPVTAGVLRGDKARFDLFGDTINTAARIESTGEPNRIHLSRETAELLEQTDKSDWLVPREATVSAKGKGKLKTFWLKPIETEEDILPTSAESNGLAPIRDIELTERSERGRDEIDDARIRRISEDIIDRRDSGLNSSITGRRISDIV